ncbi:MAG TPA: outer membrane lipoprotein carrier protein LolA [Nitrospirales bacterium]|nr:outer membrane lipoprotein carrier protein LolA [Nitrospirales bacterium]
MTCHAFAGRVALAALVLGTAWLPAPARAGDPVKDLVKKIEARYQKTTDLTAEFSQSTDIKGFAKPLQSSGRVYIKRPGKLRWDYLAPTLEQIFVDNDKVQFYIPEHKQVMVGQLSKLANSQAPLHLLQGIGRLDSHYLVSAAPAGAKGNGGLPLLSLTLIDGGPDHPRIVVEVEPGSYFLRRVELHDVNGNVSTFTFSTLRANTGLKDGLFEFTVPQDVEVVNAPTLAVP